jgi:predicted dithiol-disulfide oxidoreductase (DUF899 family)
MPSSTQVLPKVVSQEQWLKVRAELLAKEKAFTHAKDAIAAERRRMPMAKVEKNYVFDSPQGKVTLLDLFEGRQQLLLYNFMFAPGVEGWPTKGCPGCSMFTDNIGKFTLIHLANRGVSYAVCSLGPIENLEAYRKSMDWDIRWVSSANTTFNQDYGITTPQGEDHRLSAFVRDGDDIYLTYYTTARGLETIGTIWGFLDITIFGRQEQWEDSPPGWPQTPPYQWWRRHNEY